MRVFLAGATGVIGRVAINELIAGGHEVTAIARMSEKAAVLQRFGARPVRVDLLDAGEVRAAVEGHDVVVNLATSIPPANKSMNVSAWAMNDRLRREGSSNLVDAALRARAQRYIQESITFPYADGGRGWIDETHPRACAPVMHSATDAESQAARFTAAGGVGVVLRFSMICAKESSHGQAMRRSLRWRIAPLFGEPASYVSLIHVDDAATAVTAALKCSPGTYNVSEDEPLTRREVADSLAAAEGCARPFFLPVAVLALGGHTVRALMRSQRVSNRLFQRATAWAPRYKSAVHGWRESPLSDAIDGSS